MKPQLKRPHDPMALAKLVGDIATGQVVDECDVSSKLPKPSASLNTAAQCREMGIMVGDTIEGRETHIGGWWNDARLTLLWLGNEIAVWHECTRNDREPHECGWTMPVEAANWNLGCRDWRKIDKALNTELTCEEYFAIAPARSRENESAGELRHAERDRPN